MSRERQPDGRAGPSGTRLELPAEVRIRAPGVRSRVKTVEQALATIDGEVSPELARLPRWTFARALLVEAQRTHKARDLNAAFRQFKQALSNEKWLDESRQT
jgi:hypothetical protein